MKQFAGGGHMTTTSTDLETLRNILRECGGDPDEVQKVTRSTLCSSIVDRILAPNSPAAERFAAQLERQFQKPILAGTLYGANTTVADLFRS